MPERVDKQWKTKGLTGYSTEAILGTLQHYGLAMDETDFREQAEEKYPLELAASWRDAWKGTGQFQLFPYAAADELTRRLFPERLTPMQLAQALIELVAKAQRFLQGQGDELTGALDAFDERAETLPAVGDRRDAFNSELVGFLEAWGEQFNDLPKKLATAGHKALALRCAAMHETLFPDRVGCVTALVEALTGDRAAAVQKLEAIAVDPKGDPYRRHAALDCLHQVEADAEIHRIGLDVFDAAEKAQRWAVADGVAHLLASVVRRAREKDDEFVTQVARRLARAHEHVGGHH